MCPRKVYQKNEFLPRGRQSQRTKVCSIDTDHVAIFDVDTLKFDNIPALLNISHCTRTFFSAKAHRLASVLFGYHMDEVDDETMLFCLIIPERQQKNKRFVRKSVSDHLICCVRCKHRVCIFKILHL